MILLFCCCMHLLSFSVYALLYLYVRPPWGFYLIGAIWLKYYFR